MKLNSYTPYYGEKTEEEAPEIYDLVDLNEYGELDLIQLVEDEFILALPQIAMHDEADCSVDSNNMVLVSFLKKLRKRNRIHSTF